MQSKYIRECGSESKKLSGAAGVSHGCDLLTNLPEGILIQIVSLLRTKEAVRTSVLSRRWKYLWTFVSQIAIKDEDVNGNDFHQLPKFINVVDRVLRLHDAPVLESVSLAWESSNIDTDALNTWIQASVNHNVENLVLNFYSKSGFEFPQSLFTSRTLIRMKLGLEGCVLNLPKSISLTGLKSLCLEAVMFEDEVLTERFFSGCPVLEDLHLDNCSVDEIENFNILPPALRTLTIDCNCGDAFLPYKLRILSPALTSLTYNGTLTENYILEAPVSLLKASIDVWTGELVTTSQMDKRNGYSASNLLRGLYNVESLTLSHSTIKILSAAPDMVGHLPTYYNLKKLEIEVAVTKTHIEMITCILRKSPNLEHLNVSFLKFDEPQVSEEEGWEAEGSASVDLFKCLTVVGIQNFRGSNNELEFVKWLLNSASVLEIMDIEPNTKKGPEYSGVFYSVVMCRRASRFCMITLF